MITQFTQPAQQSIVDQYVPIPFEQIARIGEAYKQDYNIAEKKLSDFNRINGEFQSRSAKDMKDYYDETIGKIKPVIEKLGSNSDLLKSPEGRSLIASTLNNIDYKKLAMLKKSAESMDEEAKLRQQMVASGKRFFASQAKPTYETHSTIDNGIYNANIPMEYKGEKEVFDPYFNDVKPSIRRDSHGNPQIVNGRILKEVTDNDLARVATDASIKAMASDPLVMEHVKEDYLLGKIPREYLDKNGMLTDKYYDYVKLKAIKSQEAKKGLFDQDVDPLYMENLRAAHERSKQQQGNAIQRSEELFTAAAEGISRNKFNLDPNAGFDVSSVYTPADISEYMAKNHNAVQYNPGNKDIEELKGGNKVLAKGLKGSMFQTNARPGDVIALSGGVGYGEIAEKKSDGRGHIITTAFGFPKTKELPNIKTLIKDLNADISSGKFTNVYYKPTAKVLTKPTHYRNSNGDITIGPGDISNIQKMYIPEKQITDKYNSKQIEELEKSGILMKAFNGDVEDGENYYRVNVKANMFNQSTQTSRFNTNYNKEQATGSFAGDNWNAAASVE